MRSSHTLAGGPGPQESAPLIADLFPPLLALASKDNLLIMFEDNGDGCARCRAHAEMCDCTQNHRRNWSRDMK